MTKTLNSYELGSELSADAIKIAQYAERNAGATHHDLRALFEDAIDLLQRQAKRNALQMFDEAAFKSARP